MTDEGYMPLGQTEEKNYGTVMEEHGDVNSNGGTLASPKFIKKKQVPKLKKHGKYKTAAGAAGMAAILHAQLNQDRPEHIANLALFTMERSDGDLNWKWTSVGNLISECNDPARPPVRGCNKKFVHWKLRRMVENIYFRLFTFLLIFVDIGLVIAEIAINCAGDPSSIIVRHVELVLSIYFIIEVFFRIVALTPKVFFSRKSWHNIIDFVVVLLAFGATIAAFVIIQKIPKEQRQKEGWCEPEDTTGGKQKSTYFSLTVVLRLIRVFRFVRLLRLYFEHRNVVKAVRQRICENKRRFQVDGYDLDLTYVTTNIIAMSFPSRGTKGFYRNHVDHVAQFFEEKYSDERNIDYMIYNLCSEMEYDHRKFHGHVRRFEIDDHNVPLLEDMIRLVDDVREWLQSGEGRQRVVALHCKGGKGRTGTMICAVLINQNLFEDAGDTLQYFGQRRTDTNVSSQFQGVETYSQIRYVHYFQEVQRRGLQVIPSRPMRITGINITGLRGVGAGDGSDFTVMVQSGGTEVLQCNFKPGADNCKVKHDPKTDQLEVTLTTDVVVDKDTKFMFTCSTKGVPSGYDDCAFFFWLHTFFIKDDHMLMGREELDNPHKEKTWRVWRENFSVEVVFESADHVASEM